MYSEALLCLYTCLKAYPKFMFYTLHCFFQGGLYIYHFIHHSVGILCLFVVVLLECVALAWLYGAQRLWNNVADMTGTTDSPWWKLTWRFITPITIMVNVQNMIMIKLRIKVMLDPYDFVISSMKSVCPFPIKYH